MNKLILALILTLLSTSAFAEWTIATSSESFLVYVNLSTIRKNGDMAKMWSLYDLEAADDGGAGKPRFSFMSQDEYDCKEERSRMLALISYSEHMGKGNVVFNGNKVQQWQPVSPDSVNEFLWKTACGKQ